MSERPGVEDVVAAVDERGRDLRGLVAGLTEEQVRGACALPDWSRGHLLTHVAGAAQAMARQAEYALRGERIEVYDGGRPGRNAAIEAGAGRPAAELVADVNTALDALEAAWRRAGPEDWSRPISYRDGTLEGSALAMWRELSIHLVDLDLGYGAERWTPAFCGHAIGFLGVRLPADRTVVLVPDDDERRWELGAGERIEVRGRLCDLTLWLAGRQPERDLTCAGALPGLSPWPS